MFNSATAPTPLNGWLLTSSTAPLSPIHGTTPSCADADRVADEQIDGLQEALREPCPHCGKRRDES